MQEILKLVCDSCRGTGKTGIITINICDKCKGHGYIKKMVYTYNPSIIRKHNTRSTDFKGTDLPEIKKENQLYDSYLVNTIDRMIDLYESKKTEGDFKEGSLTSLKHLRYNFVNKRKDFAKQASEYISNLNKGDD